MKRFFQKNTVISIHAENSLKNETLAFWYIRKRRKFSQHDKEHL